MRKFILPPIVVLAGLLAPASADAHRHHAKPSHHTQHHANRARRVHASAVSESGELNFGELEVVEETTPIPTEEQAFEEAVAARIYLEAGGQEEVE